MLQKFFKKHKKNYVFFLSLIFFIFSFSVSYTKNNLLSLSHRVGAYSSEQYAMTSFTASSYELDETGVTYEWSFTAPAAIPSARRIEIDLDTSGSWVGPNLNLYPADLPTVSVVRDIGGATEEIAAEWFQGDEDHCTADDCYWRAIKLEDTIYENDVVTVTMTNITNPANAGFFYLNFSWVTDESIRYNALSGDSQRRLFDDSENPQLLFKLKVVEPDEATAVENSSVWLHTADYFKSASSTTDSEGIAYFFSSNFTGMGDVSDPAGDYVVEVSAPYDSNYTDPLEKPTVTIAEGVTNTDYFTDGDPGPIALTTPQLIGKLVVPVGCDTCAETIEAGDAISGVNIDVNDTYWDPEKSKHVQTDEAGNFRIGGLSEGTYSIEIRSPYNFSDYTGLMSPDVITDIEVDSNGKVNYGETEDASQIDFGSIEYLLATKTVTGRVTKPDGSAVSTASIRAFSMNGIGFAETTTNDNGDYTLSLGGGNWHIMPEIDYSPNYDDDPNNDVTAQWVYCGHGRSVSFAKDQTEESKTGNFQVQNVSATITGKVEYPNGSPVTGSASVNIFSKNGCGSYADLDWNTGEFSASLPSGTYSVSVSSWNEDYSSPSPKQVTVASGTTDIGTLTLVEKQAQISGRLWADGNGNNQYDSGEGVESVMVDAFKISRKFDQHAGPEGLGGPMGGSQTGFAHTISDSNGNFTLKVTRGTWMLNVMADKGMMGGGYSSDSTNYIYTGAPVQVAIESDNDSSTGNNFKLSVADATINGRLYADANDNDQFDSGEAVSGVYGFSFAEPAGSFNQGPMMGAGMGAPISNGIFEIKVPAGDYHIGVDFPPESFNYTPSGMQEVSVDSGGSATVNVKVLPNNATVRIGFKDSNGSAVTSLEHAEIFLDNSSGAHQYHRLTSEELETGYADVSVSSGNWRVGYFIDPSENDYMSTPTTDNLVTAVANETISKNIVLQEANSTIAGTVKDPDGNTLSGVYVLVDNRKLDSFDPMGGMMMSNGQVTGADGSYSLNLPAGTYKVQAFFPPEAVVSGQTVNYLNPEPREVTATANSTTTANFRFKESNATLSGTVSLNGSSRGAFISAYSNNGGYNETTSATGSYSLNVTQGDTWYVRAFSEDDNTVYLSDVTAVTIDSSAKTQNLALEQAPFTVPDAVSTTFNCANAKQITLSNGTKISIPANAIKPASIDACDSSSSDSNITITISPTTQMSLQNKSVPIGVGYEITAVDSNGVEISDTFNSNVTITIPYSDEEIATSVGSSVDESLLGNGYWDTSTSAWRNVNSEVLDTENNTLSISTNHFTLFGVLANTDPNATTGNGSDSNNSSTSSSTPQPADCDQAPPLGKNPRLYAVLPESSTSLRLYFTDADGPLDRYVLAYGLESNNYIYGSGNIGGPGTRTYVVNDLQPNTTYYFKLRAGNGCAPGGWSNEMSGTTYGNWLSSSVTDVDLTADDETVDLDLDLPKDEENCEIYEVKAGDSLWSIAQEVYGDGDKYQNLIELNKEQYPSLAESQQVDVGWKLKVKCSPISANEKAQAADVAEERDGAVQAGEDEKQEQDSDKDKAVTKQNNSRYIWGFLVFSGIGFGFFALRKLMQD